MQQETKKIFLPFIVKFNTNDINEFIKIYNHYLIFEKKLKIDLKRLIKEKFNCDTIEITIKNDPKLYPGCISIRKIFKIVIGFISISASITGLAQYVETHTNQKINHEYNGKVTFEFKDPAEWYRD